MCRIPQVIPQAAELFLWSLMELLPWVEIAQVFTPSCCLFLSTSHVVVEPVIEACDSAGPACPLTSVCFRTPSFGKTTDSEPQVHGSSSHLRQIMFAKDCLKLLLLPPSTDAEHHDSELADKASLLLQSALAVPCQGCSFCFPPESDGKAWPAEAYRAHDHHHMSMKYCKIFTPDICAGHGQVDNEEHIQIMINFIRQQKEEHFRRFKRRNEEVGLWCCQKVD